MMKRHDPDPPCKGSLLTNRQLWSCCALSTVLNSVLVLGFLFQTPSFIGGDASSLHSSFLTSSTQLTPPDVNVAVSIINVNGDHDVRHDNFNRDGRIPRSSLYSNNRSSRSRAHSSKSVRREDLNDDYDWDNFNRSAAGRNLTLVFFAGLEKSGHHLSQAIWLQISSLLSQHTEHPEDKDLWDRLVIVHHWTRLLGLLRRRWQTYVSNEMLEQYRTSQKDPDRKRTHKHSDRAELIEMINERGKVPQRSLENRNREARIERRTERRQRARERRDRYRERVTYDPHTRRRADSLGVSSSQQKWNSQRNHSWNEDVSNHDEYRNSLFQHRRRLFHDRAAQFGDHSGDSQIQTIHKIGGKTIDGGIRTRARIRVDQGPVRRQLPPHAGMFGPRLSNSDEQEAIERALNRVSYQLNVLENALVRGMRHKNRRRRGNRLSNRNQNDDNDEIRVNGVKEPREEDHSLSAARKRIEIDHRYWEKLNPLEVAAYALKDDSILVVPWPSYPFGGQLGIDGSNQDQWQRPKLKDRVNNPNLTEIVMDLNVAPDGGRYFERIDVVVLRRKPVEVVCSMCIRRFKLEGLEKSSELMKDLLRQSMNHKDGSDVLLHSNEQRRDQAMKAAVQIREQGQIRRVRRRDRAQREVKLSTPSHGRLAGLHRRDERRHRLENIRSLMMSDAVSGIDEDWGEDSFDDDEIAMDLDDLISNPDDYSQNGQIINVDTGSNVNNEYRNEEDTTDDDDHQRREEDNTDSSPNQLISKKQKKKKHHRQWDAVNRAKWRVHTSDDNNNNDDNRKNAEKYGHFGRSADYLSKFCMFHADQYRLVLDELETQLQHSMSELNSVFRVDYDLMISNVHYAFDILKQWGLKYGIPQRVVLNSLEKAIGPERWMQMRNKEKMKYGNNNNIHDNNNDDDRSSIMFERMNEWMKQEIPNLDEIPRLKSYLKSKDWELISPEVRKAIIANFYFDNASKAIELENEWPMFFEGVLETHETYV